MKMVQRRWLVLTPCVAMLTIGDYAYSATIIQSAVNPANLHTYHALVADDGFSGITATDAETFALTMGGHLATINDAAEDAWALTTFHQFYLWIGLNDVAQEGQFEWYSGEPVTYTKWAPGEPNDFGGIEDWVHYYNFGGGDFEFKWNDNANLDSIGGSATSALVEIVPEPSSLVLTIVGLLGLTACRWRPKR
ncbi:MAG: lectin-like protein [Pirellulales bacterium]